MINSTLSKLKYLSTGVQQGSTLGPLLLRLYINDPPNCLEYTTPSMYADDTKISATAETELEFEGMLSRDIECMEQWLRATKLLINAIKTEFIIMAYKHQLKHY